MDPQVQERIKNIQHEAYMRLLRVVCAQPYNWDTEELLTNTRKILNVSNEEHGRMTKDCRPGGRFALNVDMSQQQFRPDLAPMGSVRSSAAGGSFGMQPMVADGSAAMMAPGSFLDMPAQPQQAGQAPYGGPRPGSMSGQGVWR